MTNLRRLLLTLLAAVLFVGAAAPLPVEALKRDEIVLQPGETRTVKYPAFVGSNYQQSRTPKACETKQACDTIAIRLEVPEGAPPPESLQVAVEWNVRATRRVEAVGDASDNQLVSALWKSPPDKTPEGSDTHHSRSGFVAPPQTLSIFRPTLSSFLVVENAVGVNEGYTVTFTYQDVGSGPGDDRSVDESAPVDQSDDSDVAVTPSFSDDPSPSPPTGASGFSEFASSPISDSAGVPQQLALEILGITGDRSLDALEGVDDRGNFRLSAARRISTTSSGPPAPKDVPGIVLAFWLVMAPLAVAGGLAVTAIRRRSASWTLG